MTALLQSQKILGFFLGDELVCGGKRGPDTYNAVVTMANAIRSSFPRGAAILYANECGSLYGKGVKVPDAIDWISIDHYRKDTRSDFIHSVRKDFYEALVYPMMADHQKVGIIPQAVSNTGKICDSKCMAKLCLQDAKDAVHWANEDSRVALIAPYAWWRDGDEHGAGQMKDADDLRQFWSDFGVSTRGSQSVQFA